MRYILTTIAILLIGCGSTPAVIEAPEPTGMFPVQLASSYGESCVRMNNGHVYCWGLNAESVLLGLDQMFLETPVRVPDLVARDIGMSDWGMCAVDDVGQVHCSKAVNDGIDGIVEVGGLACALEVTLAWACAELCEGGLACWDLVYENREGFSIPTAHGPWVLGDSGLLFTDASGAFAGRDRDGDVLPLPGFDAREITKYLGHACLVHDDGTLLCDTPEDWALRSDIRTHAMDGGQACALVDGGVQCWGNNWLGGVGIDPAVADSVPFDSPISVDLPPVDQLSVGYGFNCALTEDRAVYCWGSAWHGQMGSGTTRRQVPPIRLADGRKYRDVFAGNRANCAITEAGEVFCWGRFGAAKSGAALAEPTRVPWLDDAEQITELGPDWCAVRGNATVCHDGSGHITHQLQCATPVINAPDHPCCLDDAGTIICGDGIPDTVAALPPAPLGLGTDDDGNRVCATLKSAVVCSDPGNPLILATIAVESPTFVGESVIVDADRQYFELDDNRLQPLDLPDGDVQQLWWREYGCVLMAEGEVWCRYDDHADAARPTTLEVGVWTEMIGVPALQKLVGGWGHTCGLTLDGDIWCWGHGGEGALGNGTLPYDWKPVKVALPTSEPVP